MIGVALAEPAGALTKTGGAVQVSWRALANGVEIMVEDGGDGLGETANLFDPFFTAKPGGSGIGLALSRQIAEAHGGSLRLENRADRRDCRAGLWLPLAGGTGFPQTLLIGSGPASQNGWFDTGQRAP